MKLRLMLFKDLEAVYAIECESFSTPWSIEAMKKELCNPLAYYVVIEKEEQVVGYGGLWTVGDEGEIINIAVKKEYRGQGIGKALLGEILNYAKLRKVFQVSLEVRQSNAIAQQLYKYFGFKEIAVRKGYYSEPKEDALMMQLLL